MDPKCSTVTLLSFWILSTTRWTVCFFFKLYTGHLFVSLFVLSLCFLTFILSFSLSGLLAYACCACRVQQCTYVFFTSTRSSIRRHLARVSFLARARSITSSFSFSFCLSFVILSFSVLGCRRMYAVLKVPSTMPWLCVVYVGGTWCHHEIPVGYISR